MDEEEQKNEIELHSSAGDNHAGASDSTSVNRPQVRWSIGGGNYPMFSSPRCFVCQCDDRVEIDRAILQGYSYPSIADKFGETRANGKSVTITPRSLKNHVDKQHLPLEQYQRRAVIDARTEELGRDIETYQGSVVDHMVVLETIQQRGFERMARGMMEPDVGETIKAATELAKIKALGGGAGVDLDQIRDAFGELSRLTMEVVGMIEDGQIDGTRKSFSQAMARMVDGSPVLTELNERWAKAQEADGQ